MVVMANQGYQTGFLFLVLFISVLYTEQLQSSQVQTLLRIKLLLNSPPSLSCWNDNIDLCSIEPTSAFAIICYEESITQLHIIGDNGVPPLPVNFSIESFVTTLVKLPSLKVLTLVSLGLWGSLPGKIARLSSLEILNFTSNFLQGDIPPSLSSLEHLQTLILDYNNFTGRLPDGLSSLSALAVLSVKNNSLTGSLPHSLGNLEDLRILRLSSNNFSGEVPDLHRLANLQVLDLENNLLGPYFPVVRDKIERIVLRENKFTFGIPSNVSSYYQMKALDISSNRFIGPFPVYLMSLPSLSYLDISENKFTGILSENFPCNDELDFVNITSNLLTGKLPSCLVSHSGKRVVLYADNCLETDDEHQHPVSFCKNEALAVGILPRPHKLASKAIVTLSICGGTLGGIILAAVTYFVVKSFLAKRAEDGSLPRFTSENTYTGYTSKFLKDARYVTQAKKLGALSLPAYRPFSLEELKEATANFNSSAFWGDGSHGQMYRGQLRDGFSVAIRCLELKRNCSTQYFRPHIETISKLRHQHLVSALGHCFEYNVDDSNLSRVYLVFEHVPNGTFRNWTSEKREGQNFTWAQRIAAVTGVAKGILFLHTGIVPGLFGNNIKITDVLVDQNLLVKVSTYNLPWISDNMGKDRTQNFTGGSKDLTIARTEHQKDKLDIYDIGVILLEAISGKPINTKNEVKVLQDQLKAIIATDDASRKSLVDPVVQNSCSNESVKTMIEICWRCLLDDPAERPSIEDVLWNLQFAAQVQEAWRGDSQSSEGSPISPLQSSTMDPTVKQ